MAPRDSDAREALASIAALLEVPPDPDEIAAAIAELQALAGEAPQGQVKRLRATQAFRLLWLVLRQAPDPEAGVTVSAAELVRDASWARASLYRELDTATGGLQLIARLAPDPANPAEVARAIAQQFAAADGREVDHPSFDQAAAACAAPVCATCGQAIAADPLTGTRCACTDGAP